MNRIRREKHTVRLMVELYCRKVHHADELCDDCRMLLDYTHLRLDRCRYGVRKPACSGCKTHCYRRQEQEMIRRVMRFSGPRMVLHHPLASIEHVLYRWII